MMFFGTLFFYFVLTTTLVCVSVVMAHDSMEVEAVMEVEVEAGVDGEAAHFEHVSSRLARLQARHALHQNQHKQKMPNTETNAKTEVKVSSVRISDPDTTARRTTASSTTMGDNATDSAAISDSTISATSPTEHSNIEILGVVEADIATESESVTTSDDTIPAVDDVADSTSTDTSTGVSSDISLLRALFATADQLPTPVGKRIALGWNSNVDLIVNGCDVVRQDFPSATPRDVEKITSLADFADSFAYWFEKGAAAERFVESAEVFKEIVSMAQAMSQRVEYKTGGNAALMATSLASDFCQCDVLLGGLVGPQLQSLLSPTIRTVPSGGSGEDAIHLIMEYSQGETWGELTSPRHNRFIVVHDTYNANIEGLESLAEMVEAESMHSPFEIFIASGLNQMEGLDPNTREIRLDAVANRLTNINANTPVHLELASMAQRDFLLHMFSTLVGHSDSLGLNEEELTMLYEVLGGTYAASTDAIGSHTLTRDMLTGSVPNPRAIGLALQYVLDVVDAIYDKEQSLRQLSRIHFHCLSFHIISIRQGTPSKLWASRVDSSVSRGAIAAVTKACAVSVEDLSAEDIKVMAPMSFMTPNGDEVHITDESPVAVWSAGGHTFHLAPVPVCRQPKNTVGLGDAISSSALAYSLN